MNELKSLLQESNHYIMTGEAYTQLKLQTKASLDTALIFVHCMERKYIENGDRG